MKTVFSLGTERKDADTLLMEVGPDYCCYAYLNQLKKSFDFITYIGFDTQESELELESVLNKVESNFEKIRICSAYEDALITPQQLFREDYSLLDVVYDRNNFYHMNDRITEWQVSALYSMPSAVYSKLLAKFPFAEFCHAYTPALKIYNGFVAPDQVDIHFTTSHFRILVKKDGGLQLAQTYMYKTPLDVVYYLLKIFYEFSLDQSEAFLIVSGLVERDSALYKEMHHYFSNLHFAQSPAFIVPGDDHPHYYFTSLYNLAACVS